MKKYNFSVKLAYGTYGTVQVDPESMYGYWEYRDGTEGGGLWFSPTPVQVPRGLELVDYDGAYELPRGVVALLKEAGFYLDDTFDPD